MKVKQESSKPIGSKNSDFNLSVSKYMTTNCVIALADCTMPIWKLSKPISFKNNGHSVQIAKAALWRRKTLAYTEILFLMMNG